jgi:hypothetical protein
MIYGDDGFCAPMARQVLYLIIEAQQGDPPESIKIER